MASSLRVFTLNCWGIPVVSSNRERRMRAIGEWLGAGHCDVACLQEVWSTGDYDKLRRLASAALPHAHYFHSGVVGSGMCVLSRHPIIETFFHQWPVNGYAHRLMHGDWWGGKGVALCRISIGEDVLQLYTVHMHAEYNSRSDEYVAHRVLQAYDTAQFVRMTGGGCCVLAGDLNAEPDELACRLLLTAGELRDVERSCSETLGATHDAPGNTYAAAPGLAAQPKRIDYVLCGGRTSAVTCVRPLPALVPGAAHSYSDHEALLATVETRSATRRTRDETDSCGTPAVLDEAVRVLDTAIDSLGAKRMCYTCVCLVLFAALCLVEDIPWPLHFLPVPLSTWKVVRLVATALMLFALVMATIWYRIEYNAFKATSLAMRTQLKHSQTQACSTRNLYATTSKI